MKYIWPILLSALLLGCSNNYEKNIEEAEKQIRAGNGDSALVLVEDVYSEELSEQLKARYAIVVGDAHDMRGDAMSEDALLPDAFEYYKSTEPVDSAKLLQATLLLAKYYWWNGEKEQSRAVLEKALAEYQKKSTILLTMNELASRDDDIESCNDYLKQLLELNPNTDMTFLLRYNLAVTAFYLNKSEEARDILKDLSKYVKMPQDSTMYWQYVVMSHADIESECGDQHEAIRLQKMAIEHFKGDSAITSISYASMCRYYLLLGDVGTARHCLQMADDFATAEIKANMTNAGYYKIMHILLRYVTTHKIDGKDWIMFVNSLQSSKEVSQKITEANKQANLQMTERNYKLTIENQRKQILVLCLAFACVVVVSGFVMYVRKKNRAIVEKDDELDTLRRMITESQSCSNERDDRFFKKVMLQQLGVIRMAAANPTTANQELLKRMQEIADKDVAVDSMLNWPDLYKTIDFVYDRYYSHLVERFGQVLNERELQLCCLLRANFSTKEISIVTQQSVRTVYQRKTVIRQKLGVEEKGDIASVTSV